MMANTTDKETKETVTVGGIEVPVRLTEAWTQLTLRVTVTKRDGTVQEGRILEHCVFGETADGRLKVTFADPISRQPRSFLVEQFQAMEAVSYRPVPPTQDSKNVEVIRIRKAG